MDLIDRKYFKLAVGTPLKDTLYDISLNCPLCGDTKGRLHMYQKSTMDAPLIRCFNEGCELENHQGMSRFLDVVDSTLSLRYKKEKFNKSIDSLKEGDSLNDILSSISDKPAPVKKEVLPLDSSYKLPKLFTDMLDYAKDVPEAVEYIESRNLEVQDDWLFSKDTFVNIFEKAYYVENFIFIPLWQNNKLRGFYTRSINEKRFSTIIFPNGEKYWVSHGFDPAKPCYIFEGILDAISSGLDNTCAMLSADLPDDFICELAEPIFCLDNDKTGVEKALKFNAKNFKTFVWPDIDEKDVNVLLKRLTKEEIRETILSNIYSGLTAKIKLNLIRV